VFTIPKLLRPYFLHHRELLGQLSRAAWETVAELIADASGRDGAGNALFSGFGGFCESTNNGDPVVIYDHIADRWFLSQFAVQSVTDSRLHLVRDEVLATG